MTRAIGIPLRRVALVLASVVVSACPALLHPLHVVATPIPVTNCNDSGTGSLRAAIGAAMSGDTITFTVDCPGGSYIGLLSTLVIPTSMTIDGAGHAVIVDGVGAVRVFTVNSGNVTLNNLTIRLGKVTGACTGYAATGCGGGIFNSLGATLTVTNSTFSANSADKGGGIYNLGALTVTNSTFADNSATTSGGAITYDYGSVTLTNTLLADNTAPGGAHCGRAVFDGGNNLEFNPSNTCGFFAASHDVFTDPLLGPHSQVTDLNPTIALLPGSGAIDAGANTACPATDQRGIARPVNGTCDIGAFESQGFTLVKSRGDGQSALPGAPFALSLTVTVTSSHGESVSGNGAVVAFTVNPTGGAGATLQFATALIDPNGLAYVGATANSTAGTYTVTASVRGAPSATFTLTNTPVLSGIGPATGGTAGGNRVTLSGVGFDPAGNNTQVLVDATPLPAASIVSVSSTQIVYLTPAHAAGNATVTARVNGATSAGQTYIYDVVNPLPAPQGATQGSPPTPLPQTQSPAAAQGGPPAPLPPRRP